MCPMCAKNAPVICSWCFTISEFSGKGLLKGLIDGLFYLVAEGEAGFDFGDNFTLHFFRSYGLPVSYASVYHL